MFKCTCLLGGSKLFTATHEWIEDEGSNVAKVGISKYAQVCNLEICYSYTYRNNLVRWSTAISRPLGLHL